MVAGSINHPKLGYGSKDVLVVKLDKTGKILSEMILGGKGLDEVEKVIPTKDGGVLMGIYSRSSAVESTMYQVQSTGNLNRASSTPLRVTDGSATSNADASAPLSLTGVQSGNSSNVILSGAEGSSVSHYSKTTDNYGEGDYWVVKLDKNGKVQWEKSFGGNEDDHIRTMALTDSGYIIGGESRSRSSGNKRAKVEEGTDLWVLALDEDGNEEWQQSYSFGNRDVMMSLDGVRKMDDGSGKTETKGFLIGGFTQAEGKVQKNDETFWMLYIDKNGKEVWRKYVEGKDKKKEERLTSAILNRDGSYILAGTSAEELGSENWKVVKLLDSDVENLMENKDIRIYPNPVKDYCYVELNMDGSGKPDDGSPAADIYVYDMTGKVVQQLQTRTRVTKVNTGKLPQGVYIIKASIPTQQDKQLTAKIVKE